jgi:hypothetical protein
VQTLSLLSNQNASPNPNQRKKKGGKKKKGIGSSRNITYLLTRVFAGFLASSKEAGFVYGGYFASGTERKFDISTMA